MNDLEGRVRRLEDHQSIVDVVIRYCVAVDGRDWAMFADCFAPTVRTGAGEVPATEFVEMVEGVLPGFGSTQHLSTNHVVTFEDADRATCESDMCAQHHLAGSPGGDYYLLRARYSDHLVRTPHGWRIDAITTTNRWEEGNLDAVTEAGERVRLQRAAQE